MGFFKRLFGIADTTAVSPMPGPSAPAAPMSAWEMFDENSGMQTMDLHSRVKAFLSKFPKMDGGANAMDEACEDGQEGYLNAQPNLSDELYMWYARNGFIGHQMAALIAQHWLIQKACAMPARDALRKGWELNDGNANTISDDIATKIASLDRRLGTAASLNEFIVMGRVFGVRIAIPDVSYVGDYDEAISAPFNIDSIREGSFKGWIQVDPYWCAPILNNAASGQPDSKHFFDPTWWLINGRKYHRTHLIVYRHGFLPDILKPAYQYGGIPLPQLIMERVYNAERTANEAPLLALTKRTMVYKTDLSEAAANMQKFTASIAKWSRLWSNMGVRVAGEAEEISQFDTGLADMDSVIMTQYQLVAAIAEVPATKLLGTSAKGFNATGEHDEANYHESLESIQNSDLTPFLERHYALLCKSENITDIEGHITPRWPAMDAPTELERAQTNQATAAAAASLVTAGVINTQEERARLAREAGGMYAGVIDETDGGGDLGDLLNGDETGN